LNELRKVSTDEGQDLATAFGCHFAEASAKTRDNLEYIFYELVRAERKRRAARLAAKDDKTQTNDKERKKPFKAMKKKLTGKDCSLF